MNVENGILFPIRQYYLVIHLLAPYLGFILYYARFYEVSQTNSSNTIWIDSADAERLLLTLEHI